ncbi:transglutaminase-like domain-containing protein [Kosmotoga pacifica]|uniref:Transglutaminase n=1 Tax=Kosmotoga pacifica TaxID=1330330 RepID=A0A0G2Z8W7_9BACT|nr:transglutaminase-like domain-containing protein [Kosmotoga pacifica]AKI96516.1 transglutaminase [Kosmotoga pacifica]
MFFLNVPLYEELEREEKLGNFKKAKTMISEKLKSESLPSSLRKRLEFELERIDRLIKNYPFNEESARKKLFESIDDFTEEEYHELMAKGLLDYIVVEGEKKFETRFFENLIFALPEYKKRTKKDEKQEEVRKFLYSRLEALLSGDKPKTYRVNAEIEVKPAIEKINGKHVRCWLPFPKVEAQVLDAKLIEVSHNKYFIAPNDAPHRTIYMEDELKEGLKFSVRFEYVIREQFNSVDPGKVSNTIVPGFSQYLQEKPPHIVFTPYLKNLTEEIVGNETNPYLKAKKIYDWITHNVRYSFMHPYALYENIPMFVASNLRGDCGAQASLFITLCRIAGVPARWQSGWYANPFFASPHDWTMFYVEPYGWLPADLSFGGRRPERPEWVNKFYFGNLDAFRMVANSEYMAALQPAKKYLRSDPYDNQVGELETEAGNIYNDAFDSEMKIISFEEISL